MIVHKNEIRKDLKMKKRGKLWFMTGLVMVVLFIVWTVLVQTVDVKIVESTGTTVGFATVNEWFHQITKVHMWLYTVTDWFGLVPVIVCMIFGMIGFIQMIKRKSLWKVDHDILLLGVYYVIVILGYLLFEMISINYRPILIEGRLEVSYPSSTTLLVLSIMPTLIFQTNRRLNNKKIQQWIALVANTYTLIMVVARMISGVHWVTDIIGSILLSMGLFAVYQGVVLLCEK